MQVSTPSAWMPPKCLTMFEARTGLPGAAIADKLSAARAHGWLDADQDWLRPTELGRRFANDVIGLFLD